MIEHRMLQFLISVAKSKLAVPSKSNNLRDKSDRTIKWLLLLTEVGR